MPEHEEQIVRQPIRPSAQSHRRMEERLSLRFPRLPVVVNRALFRVAEERIRSERGWRDGWDDFRYEPEELIDLADQRVLLLGRMSGSGPASGVVLESDWADLLAFSRGQVIREQVFFDNAEALTAIGLSE